MIIADLDYLASDDETEPIRGGLALFPIGSVYTSAIAVTQPGLAFANAQALATGQNTYTATQVYANTIVNPVGTLSYAYASAVAYSSNNYGTLRSQSDYFSLSISASASIQSATYAATLSLT